MHSGLYENRSRTRVMTLGLVTVLLGFAPARADDPGIFGRFFRGGNSQASSKPGGPTPTSAKMSASRGASTGAASSNAAAGRGTSSLPLSESRFDSVPPSGPSTVAVSEGLSTPPTEVVGDQGAMPKITPKSRVNRPITNSEPILTKFALGRSNDGTQFGMFMEVFADGTVLDSEGVHHVSQADLQPVVEAIQRSDFSKVRGHSGAPPTDFIDNVQIIVFDRRMGRLTAHPFSYSGNPQGSDHAIRHIHTALEGLQMKLSRPAQAAGSNGAIGITPAVNSGSDAAAGATPAAPNGIPLSSSAPALEGTNATDSGKPLASPPLPNPSVGQGNPASPRAPRVSAR